MPRCGWCAGLLPPALCASVGLRLTGPSPPEAHNPPPTHTVPCKPGAPVWRVMVVVLGTSGDQAWSGFPAPRTQAERSITSQHPDRHP
jgi:hypothetical protein